ncbi:hypothetical protein SCHPADRAFT_895117 [Schizopora paradoxa]|uniref:C2H2-type domain-containing protein n=1 Tax=Schizopora paradoxa TaxID=27342 RepID=A0A0H2RPS2_9AGAM|nr:hypothetical protein SCHPADRAFT_895117 [Schizopora paradoxa]
MDPIFPAYPRHTFVQTVEHAKDSVNYPACLKPSPNGQGHEMSIEEATELLQKILDGAYANDAPLLDAIFAPLPADLAKPGDAGNPQKPEHASYIKKLQDGEGKWYEREVIFKGVLPKNFVPSGNKTYFSAFGPTPWYVAGQDPTPSEDTFDPADAKARSPSPAPMEMMERGAATDATYPSTYYYPAPPVPPFPEQVHTTTGKRGRDDEESISAARSEKRLKDSEEYVYGYVDLTPAPSCLSPEESRVRDFLQICFRSIGRDIDMSELQAPSVELLYQMGSKHRYRRFTHREWEAVWRRLVKIALGLRFAAAEDYKNRLDDIIVFRQGLTHICPVEGCPHSSSDPRALYEHILVHVVRGFFCPKCKTLFSGFDDLDAHLDGIEDPNRKPHPCLDLAREYHYLDHKHIFSMMFLGALESYGISSDLFRRLAMRERGLVYVNLRYSRAHDLLYNETMRMGMCDSKFVMPRQGLILQKK